MKTEPPVFNIEKRPDYDPTLWRNVPTYAEDKMTDVESKIDRAQLYPEIIETIRETYESGDSILDVGCAGGHFYLTLKKLLALKNLDYTGIDVTPEYIEFAHEKFPDVKWHVGDVRKLPFSDGQFDHTLCLFVLVHLGKPGVAAAVKELTRVTKKQVILAGYFAKARVDGIQNTEGHDFIYDIVGIQELITDGWTLQIAEEEVGRHMRLGTDVQNEDGSWSQLKYNVPIHSYVRLVKK